MIQGYKTRSFKISKVIYKAYSMIQGWEKVKKESLFRHVLHAMAKKDVCFTRQHG